MAKRKDARYTLQMMKISVLVLASLAALSSMTALQGCASIAGPVPGEAGPPATDLIFGARAIGGVNGGGWLAEAQKRQVQMVILVSESNVGNVDVIMRASLKNRGGTIVLETVSARTGESLTYAEVSYLWGSQSWRETINHLVVNFRKDTDLYKKIAAERDGAKPAAAGITKAELERMLNSAVGSRPPAEPAEKAKASDVDAPRYKGADRPDDVAIVIGIDGYSDLPSAQYAERDAAAVRRHLAALGVPERNMVSLLGAKAGKAAFVKTFETWLPLNVTEDSTVWIYYSGHGAPEPRTGTAFLMPWDGDPRFLDDTAYPVKRLYAKLNDLKVKRVIVALDSCFSGAGGRSVLAKGLRPLVGKIDTGAVSGKIVSLTASAGEEVSGTLDEQGHGLFTYHLLSGLNGAAADGRGRVTMEGLYGYLSGKVRDDSRRQNREQTPQLLQSPGAAAAILLR